MTRGPELLGALLVLVGITAMATACRGPEAKPKAPGSPADAARVNKLCLECHIDFEDEELTLAHQRAGVSCARCHGPSRAHMEDEVRATKPDAIFRGAAMEIFCLTCHGPALYRARPEHAANVVLEPKRRKSCTQCHGEHKLLEIQG